MIHLDRYDMGMTAVLLIMVIFAHMTQPFMYIHHTYALIWWAVVIQTVYSWYDTRRVHKLSRVEILKNELNTMREKYHSQCDLNEKLFTTLMHVVKDSADDDVLPDSLPVLSEKYEIGQYKNI